MIRISCPSYNQVIAQKTPDGGKSTFWYDILGLLVASQNSEQLAPKNLMNNSANRYSYTKYDSIGRITEVGEKYSGTVLLPIDDDVVPHGSLNTKINAQLNTWYASGTDKQVTATIYDQPNTSIVTNSTITSLQTTNSRKRVVTSYLKEQKSNPTYDAATHYVYDINGNVRTLFQENIALKTIEGGTSAGLRQINYDYDLISGKVNKVVYQPGKGDQFHYRYEYDADNRIIDAYSSRNGLQWQKDAHYYYYLHGPLARVELGKYQVQGVDYAYTLQGWLKGINSQSLDVAKDMAGDGNPASPAYQKFGRDVYGFSLGYHNNDYKPIGGSAANAFDKVFTTPSAEIGTTGNTGAQLFNGNISNTTVALNKINSGQAIGYSYLYDQLNRLLGMRQHSISGTSWNYSSFNTAYEEKFSYDANGNIKTLVRKGANITGMPLAMDNLKYFYYYTNTSNARAEYDPTVALPGNVKSLSNQLAYVTDGYPAGNYTDDIDNQTAGNYDYDNIGNLMKNNAEGITGIEWTVYGKIKQIKKGAVTINYTYDVSGNRISKEVIGAPGGTTKQFYIRDAQGNTMAIYNGKTSYVEWAEQHLYGSSRLGIWNYGKTVPLLPLGTSYDSMMVGSYNYELTNHLGNVLSTISDKKVGVSVGGVTVDYYNAEVLGQNDYYAFGSQMRGRKYSLANGEYRYGFNGKEKSDEVTSDGYDFGARVYDGRLGRWLSTDIVTKPFISPYNYSSNNPVNYLDPDGEDNIHFYYVVVRQYADGKLITVKTNKFYTVEKTNTPNVFVHHKYELKYNNFGSPATVGKPVSTQFYPDQPSASSGLTSSYLGLIQDNDRKTLIKFIDEYSVSRQSVDGDYAELSTVGSRPSDRLKKAHWWADVFKEKKYREENEADQNVRANFVLGVISVFGGEELLVSKILGRIATKGVTNTVTKSESVLGHIFRDAPGHVNPSTVASQDRYIRLFESVANNSANLNQSILAPRAIENGVQGFTKSYKNGQIWVQVKNGKIFNAGVNVFKK